MQSAKMDSFPSYAGSRALVADDNAINCRIAVRMLEQLDFEVDVATTGQEVLALHAQKSYQFILMDCSMPDMDGYQATRHIRAREKEGQHTPIIGWTGGAQANDLENCVAAGMDGLIAKNLQADALQNLLARWLPPNASQASAEEKNGSGDTLEAIHRMIGPGFADLVVMFQSDMQNRMTALQFALQQQNNIEFARLAHLISGSCASIGAFRLSTLCQELESMARTSSLANLSSKLEEMRQEYSTVIGKLQIMLGRQTGT